MRSERCGGCDGCDKGCSDKLSYGQLFNSVLAAVMIWLVLIGFSATIQASKQVECYTRESVAEAVQKYGLCLTIYDDKVYDLSLAKKWDLTGHVGKHLCGREYDKKTIEDGPHMVGVMDKFYKAPICGSWGENQIDSTTKSSISLRVVMIYVSLVFFVLNFATCYAMPWSKIKEPWAGSRPGRDKNDLVGRFPLTHMHKVWAWLAIFSLTLHAILGFSCMLLGKCF